MPSLTRCVCTINTFIHFIFGNHNSMARGDYNDTKRYFRADMLVRPYNSMKYLSTEPHLL